MAVNDIKQSTGYTPNPVERQPDPQQASSNAGDAPPPAPSASLAPQVSQVVPGEAVKPQASVMQPHGLDNSVYSGIGESLSGLLAQLSPEPTEQPVEPVQVASAGTGSIETLGAPTKAPSILSQIAPQQFNSVEKVVGTTPAPAPAVDPTLPNQRGYTSVLPGMLGVEKPKPAPAPVEVAAVDPKSRTMGAYIAATANAPVNPATISSVVEAYKANPAAFTVSEQDIDDVSPEVSSSWNFGEMSQPNALVVHHTAGGGDRDGVINTFKERGFPAHFIIERDGKIVQVLGINQKGQHTKPAQDGSDISNSNSWGVEIIAKDDSDVTPTQVQAAIKLTNLLETHGLKRDRIVGHGQINSHKQATEGKTVLDTIAQIGG